MFRNGRFMIHGDMNDWIILRKGSQQWEINSQSGDTTWMTVEWINPCQYIVRRENMEDIPGDSTGNLRRRIPLVVTIVKTAKDFYIFESHKNGTPMGYFDTMWVASPN